jgi:4-alpha-glucanotransferase
MGLHRLFWIPDGFPPRDGVYVQYPADAQWAIVSLESHRHRCRVVGEDLGTVPAAVRRAMADHGVLRTWVAQFAHDGPTMPRPPRRAMAWLSTHDTPTFAAWWPGKEPSSALTRHLDALGRSQAEVVVVTLEDLWGEREPQNVPGTASDTNWCRRHAHTLRELEAERELSSPLASLARSRPLAES